MSTTTFVIVISSMTILVILIDCGLLKFFFKKEKKHKITLEKGKDYLSEREDYQQIKKVFAFEKGSINTSYMAGDRLPRNDFFNPTINNIFFRFVKSLFKRDNEKNED